MATVEDFRKYLLQQARVDDHVDFCQRSPKCMAFWRKLNKIGARNIAEQPPELVPNIDATVILASEEWLDLEGELQGLLAESQ